MSTYRRQLVMLPVRRTESIHRAAQHLRLWLAAAGVTYDQRAREAFVRAHPALFGRAYEVTLHGFHHWHARHGVADTVDAFAHYIANRHERWFATTGQTTGLPPCLVGLGTAEPCWKSEAAQSIAQIDVSAA